MVQFRCSNSDCSFSADVFDPPGAADAMACPLCSELAIAELPDRPAFRCERCHKIFRASGSMQNIEPCAQCGGRGQRIGLPDQKHNSSAAGCLFARLTAAERRQVLDLNDVFLDAILKSRRGEAEVTGIDVEDDLALAAKLSDEELRQAIEIVLLHKDALAASESGDHRGAIALFKKIVELAPFDAISWMSLGVQYAFLQNGQKAIECLERALAEDPDNERIRANLEAVRADFSVAQPPSQPAPVSDQTHTVPAEQKPAALSQPQQNVLDANRLTQDLIEFWNSADMEPDRQRGFHACDCCETPVASNTGRLVKPNSGVALSVDVPALEAKVAAERFQTVSRRIADLAADFKEIGGKRGANYERLKGGILELLAESPFDTRLLLALGTIEFNQHRFDEAVQAYSEASRCAPADAVIHYHLGKVHEQLGKAERALRDYDRARRLDFTSPQHRTAYVRLERKLHAPKKTKSAPRAEIEKLLTGCEYDRLVTLDAAAVEGLTAIIEDRSKFFIRRAATTVLSRIGEAAVPALARLVHLDPQKFDLHSEVIGALSLIGSEGATRILVREQQALAAAKACDLSYQCVVAALIRVGDNDSRELLLQALRDKDPAMRRATLEGLRSLSNTRLQTSDTGVAVLSDVDLTESVVERCRLDEDVECRWTALQVLHFTRLVEAPRIAAASLQDPATRIRAMAASVLRDLAERHVPLSLTGGTTPTACKRGDLWDSSGWTGPDGAIGKLIPLLGEQNRDIQRDAGQALGYLGDLALPALVSAARTANDDVRTGLGWVSQTMHESGRRLLADCGVKLSLRQRTPVIRIQQKAAAESPWQQQDSHWEQHALAVRSKAAGIAPGDMHISIPDDGVWTYIFRDAKGQDRALRKVYDGTQHTLCGVDRDDLPEGAIVESIHNLKPGEIVPSKQNAHVTDEVRQLNGALPNLWSAIKFSSASCACCGIVMPTSEDSDFMNLGFLGVVQNNPQAIVTAVKVTAAYYLESSGPDLSNVNIMFGARTSIFNWARLTRCDRCQSWICRRCHKLPHDKNGCSLCTKERKRREELPGLVCETCFIQRRFEPWQGANRHDADSDLAAIPIPRRDQATAMLKPFYEKWSITRVEECAACGLLMPRDNIMLPLLKRVAQETGQSYESFVDATAKLWSIVLGPNVLGDPRTLTAQETLLQQLYLVKCGQCGKSLCPACLKLGSSTRCVVCGTK